MIGPTMYELLAIVAVTALYAYALHWWKQRRLNRAVEWPTAEGYVAQIKQIRDDNGLLKVTLAYTYKVQDKRFVGRETFTFIRDDEAARFEAGCKHRSVRAHYRPGKPQVSVLERREMG